MVFMSKSKMNSANALHHYRFLATLPSYTKLIKSNEKVSRVDFNTLYTVTKQLHSIKLNQFQRKQLIVTT